MTSFKTLALAALLSAVAATPVFAQAAIQEPGEFAFYHPNLDVLNGGAPIDTAPPEASMAYGARESGIFPQYRAYAASTAITATVIIGSEALSGVKPLGRPDAVQSQLIAPTRTRVPPAKVGGTR